MKPLAVLFLLLAGCSTTIHGVVRDKVTGNPISAIAVSVGDQNVTTNAFGVFTIVTKLKMATLLVVNAPGYFMHSAMVAKRGDEGGEIIRDVELVQAPPGVSTTTPPRR